MHDLYAVLSLSSMLLCLTCSTSPHSGLQFKIVSEKVIPPLNLAFMWVGTQRQNFLGAIKLPQEILPRGSKCALILSILLPRQKYRCNPESCDTGQTWQTTYITQDIQLQLLTCTNLEKQPTSTAVSATILSQVKYKRQYYKVRYSIT